jgi:hypothetical protein
MKKRNARDNEQVYNKSERDEIIRKMREVSGTFYAGAVKTHNHPFIEFCGILNEFISVCQNASEDGIDFTQTNRHSGAALPIQPHNARYLGEKVGCIYGPSLGDPKVFMAFIESFDLPFDVKIVAKEKHEPEEHPVGLP